MNNNQLLPTTWRGDAARLTCRLYLHGRPGQLTCLVIADRQIAAPLLIIILKALKRHLAAMRMSHW